MLYWILGKRKLNLQDGSVKCTHEDDTKCPPLNCPVSEQFSISGECCRFCPGMDFCGMYQESQCHSNATCRNLKTNFLCTCKEGYWGNGLLCQDINECLREGAFDGPNCGLNTRCVNTPGSYSCQCLDGFEPIPGVGFGQTSCVGQYLLYTSFLNKHFVFFFLVH